MSPPTPLPISTGVWKVPLPLPNNTLIPPEMSTAKSSFPSPLKSAAANVLPNDVIEASTPVLKAPPPFPVNSQMPLGPVTTTSGIPSPIEVPHYRVAKRLIADRVKHHRLESA